MLFAILFVTLRFWQIILLTPIVGMLGWFVNKYNNANLLTPDSILVLFIVSVIAITWSVLTLFSYHRSSANGMFVALVDLGIFGALIGGLYELRGIRHANCTNVDENGTWTTHIGDLTVSGPGFHWTTDKSCAMLKASWALAIIQTIMFFCSAIVAVMHGDKLSRYDEKRRVRSHSHSSRHHHRHRSHSGGSRGSYSQTRRVHV